MIYIDKLFRLCICLQARPLGYPPPGMACKYLFLILAIVLPTTAQGNECYKYTRLLLTYSNI